MKEFDISESIARAAKAGRENGKHANWPMCMICLKGVDAAFIENVSSKSCEIRARCHGAEDHYKVTWKELNLTSVTNDILADPNVGWAINRAIKDGLFFKPDNHFDFSSKR